MKRILAALAAVVALGLSTPAHATPTVSIQDIEWITVYNDTLAATADSAASNPLSFTRPFGTLGARGLVITVQSSGSDSIAVPFMQFSPDTTTWTLHNSTGFTGSASWSYFVTATSAITALPRIATYFVASTVDGGFPLAIMVPNMRMRIKSANARRHLNNTTATNGTSGVITVKVAVIH